MPGMIDARKIYYTPPQLATRLGVKPETIIRFIRRGELRAFDVSGRPGIGRPRFRIAVDAVIEFENKRSPATAARPARRRRKDPAIIEYF